MYIFIFQVLWSILHFDVRFQDSERVVSREEGIALAKEHGSLFLECSAKTRENVEQCFEQLALKVLFQKAFWCFGKMLGTLIHNKVSSIWYTCIGWEYDVCYILGVMTVGCYFLPFFPMPVNQPRALHWDHTNLMVRKFLNLKW